MGVGRWARRAATAAMVFSPEEADKNGVGGDDAADALRSLMATKPLRASMRKLPEGEGNTVIWKVETRISGFRYCWAQACPIS